MKNPEQKRAIKEAIDGVVCMAIATAVVGIPLSILIYNYNNPSRKTPVSVEKTSNPNSSTSNPQTFPSTSVGNNSTCDVLREAEAQRQRNGEMLGDRQESNFIRAKIQFCGSAY